MSQTDRRWSFEPLPAGSVLADRSQVVGLAEISHRRSPNGKVYASRYLVAVAPDSLPFLAVVTRWLKAGKEQPHTVWCSSADSGCDCEACCYEASGPEGTLGCAKRDVLVELVARRLLPGSFAVVSDRMAMDRRDAARTVLKNDHELEAF